jgi:hypothetical protein
LKRRPCGRGIDRSTVRAHGATLLQRRCAVEKKCAPPIKSPIGRVEIFKWPIRPFEIFKSLIRGVEISIRPPGSANLNPTLPRGRVLVESDRVSRTYGLDCDLRQLDPRLSTEKCE